MKNYGMSYYLGKDVFDQCRDFLPFSESKIFVYTLKLKSKSEWDMVSNKFPNIPNAPDVVYKYDGWISWGDFLGTGFIATQHRKYPSFEEAREFARSLGLNSYPEWRQYIKKNPSHNVSGIPNRTYKHSGWISWGDFLGTERIANKLKSSIPFRQARSLVRSLGFKKREEWFEYYDKHKPDGAPKFLNQIYSNHPDWKGMGEFIGTGHSRNHLSFEEAREFVRSLGLKSWVQWQEYCKSENKPSNIPSRPSSKYKNDGWINRQNWLGYTNEERFMSFEEARRFVRKLNIKGQIQWREYWKNHKRPKNLPSNPYTIYLDNGWISWMNFLGYQRQRG